MENVSFAELEARFDRCDVDERQALAEFLIAFAECDRRRLPIEHGYSSSFAYLTEKRRYSKSAAGRRIVAARLIAKHPAIAEWLRDGRVGLTNLCILGDLLEGDDFAEVLGRASGLNEDDTMRLKATLRPQTPPPDLIRKLPAVLPVLGVAAPPPATQPSCPAPARAIVLPVSAELSVFRMTVGQAFLADYRRLRDLLSHKLPAGRAEDLLHDAVRVAIDHYTRKRLGTGGVWVRRPTKPGSRHIPAEIRRAVWQRDGGRCSYVAPDGKRCDATWQVQDDHACAFARGGTATVDNIRLRCSAHNRLQAEQDFGRAHVAARIQGREALCPERGN